MWLNRFCGKVPARWSSRHLDQIRDRLAPVQSFSGATGSALADCPFGTFPPGVGLTVALARAVLPSSGGHAVQSAPGDAKDLGSPGLVPGGMLQHLPHVPVDHLLQ